MRTETIFEFVKYSIGSIAQFAPTEEIDWEEMYGFAKKQTIIGVLFMGIEKLPKERRPEKKLLMKWYAQTERIKQKNETINAEVVTVFDRFRKAGFRGCVLKGQGMASLYPNPFLRIAGDIDIWIEGSRREIVDYVNSVCPGQKLRKIHIDFPIFQKTLVEVHFTPSYMFAPWANKHLQRWFKEQAEEQFGHEVELPGGAGTVCMPTLPFNRIFILSHIYKHLFSEGIGLRQLMDYYYVLRCGFTEEENNYDRKTLRSLGMYKFAGAVMYVLQRVFGLQDDFCIVEPNKKAGEFLLSEVLQSGNFGHNDERYVVPENESVAHRYFRLSHRSLHLITKYPTEALSEPLVRTWFFFWRFLNKN